MIVAWLHYSLRSGCCSNDFLRGINLALKLCACRAISISLHGSRKKNNMVFCYIISCVCVHTWTEKIVGDLLENISLTKLKHLWTPLFWADIPGLILSFEHVCLFSSWPTSTLRKEAWEKVELDGEKEKEEEDEPASQPARQPDSQPASQPAGQ